MINAKKLTLIFTIVIIMTLFVTSTGYANSAEPPSITIIVPNPPNDIDIRLDIGEEYINSIRVDKLTESYFSFYSSDLGTNHNYDINMIIGENSSTIKIDKPLDTYNNIYTLDWENETLEVGKAPFRSIKLIAIRVVLTLILEAIIFLLFGFKSKKSWVIFIVVNLITQGVLNIWLNIFSSVDSYVIFGLIIAEIFVFITEIIAFLVLVREQGKLKTAIYVIIANLLSLIAGGCLISYLPI